MSEPTIAASVSFPAPLLPADLGKLRQRYAQVFPEALARADRLASVPAAFRHVLALELELERSGALPRRHRRLARGEGTDMTPADPPKLDPVDRMVRDFGLALRAGRRDAAAALLRRLARFFTAPQLAELALSVTLASCLRDFDAVMGGDQPPRPRAVRKPAP